MTGFLELEPCANIRMGELQTHQPGMSSHSELEQGSCVDHHCIDLTEVPPLTTHTFLSRRANHKHMIAMSNELLSTSSFDYICVEQVSMSNMHISLTRGASCDHTHFPIQTSHDGHSKLMSPDSQVAMYQTTELQDCSATTTINRRCLQDMCVCVCVCVCVRR